MNARQLEIITELGTRPAIEPSQEIEIRVDFLKRYLAHTGLNGFVLGISGGQDSLLAGLLAKRATDEHQKDGHTASFHAVLLPYGEQTDRDDALLACEIIGPDVVHDFDIKDSTDALTQTFDHTEQHPLSDFNKGNVKARMRMIAQYALAGENKLLVVGTDHAAEAVTGFFTKFGDGGADVLPLSGLTKRQGRQLLEELAVPEVFLTKKPTADLLDSTPGQTDEHELGISYDNIDSYLEGRRVDEAIATQIEQRYDATWHKRNLPVAFTPESVVG